MCALMKCCCVLYECVNPIYLGDVLPKLLFNQFLRVLCITEYLRVKETALERDNARQQCSIFSY